MLRFNNLSLRRGTKCLFEQADFTIFPGQKVGLTGANGAGKSSLFALILGELHSDAGEFDLPPKWEIAHVAQESPATEQSAIDYVMDGDAGLRLVQRRLVKAEERGSGALQAELHAELAAVDGYRAPSRAATLLHGLGFTSADEGCPMNAFSGGWRMRLNLARALMCRSDLLLLDEPTNHLDLDAVIWLEDWLRLYPGTLLLISHDRDFLDAVVTQVAHIEQGRVRLYSGNYSAFERIRCERLAQQQAAFDKQQREIDHVRHFIDRFRAQATKARQAQSRLKALQRMEQIAPAHVDSPFHFEFLAPEKNPTPLLSLEQAAMGYPGKEVLNVERLVINSGDRIGLLGHNGAGKSTLVRTLAGEQPMLGGRRVEAQDLKIGYFAQHQLDQLHSKLTPVEHLLRLAPRAAEQQLRDFLGGFGFSGERALEPVAPFSGGEKARLVLALVVYQRPNLLLLDEPTNHLDLEMRQALSIALQSFEGAVLLVSHDRHLMRSTADLLWLVNAGAVAEFPDAIDDYPRWLARQQALAPVENGDMQPLAEHSAAGRKERKRLEAEQRQRLLPLTKRLKELERELDDLNGRRDLLQLRLADNGLYDDSRKEELKALLAERTEIEQRIEVTENAWMRIGEELEGLQKIAGSTGP
ncbi:MAG: ATP-binding cassette domain-containing protein [Gammaproteobacteria bacterium]|nr:ATP-binding cassette domain-containing protein [Gammaproteobacteria bacterium]MBU1654714.1 ATP-binding cassette domain-containing protein [Gammaproteobacteria bacterium]MBU1959635.1 ATP-binding cassette domain-containing protein [Gammaproteobacteria bacterium]